MQSCCSTIASACPLIALTARRLRQLRISCCSLARLHPLQLLFPVCVHFQLLLPDCARFSCCCMLAALRPLQLLLPIASASAAAPRLHPLRLLLPDCIRFGCCSPIACIRLQPQLDSSPMFSKSSQSSNKLKYEGRASL